MSATTRAEEACPPSERAAMHAAIDVVMARAAGSPLTWAGQHMLWRLTVAGLVRWTGRRYVRTTRWSIRRAFMLATAPLPAVSGVSEARRMTVRVPLVDARIVRR